MKTLSRLTLPLLAVTGLVLAGCPADDAPPIDDSTTGDDTTAGPTTNTTPPTTTTMTDPDTTAGTDTDTATDTDETTTTGDPEDPYVFREDPFDMYTQVDRMGFPAVNTGLNILGDKDAYNAGSPAEDVDPSMPLPFHPNILESLEYLHLGTPMMQVPNVTGLDDDLQANGLTPCRTPPMMMSNCDDQVRPFVLPDVIEIYLDEETGFPNGRQLGAPVMDLILAVLLLDLNEHPLTKFVDLDEDGELVPSLNPLANDVDFEAEFPYLAPAHE